MRSTLAPRRYPAPPKICIASLAQNSIVEVARFFSMQISATGFSPCPTRYASNSSVDFTALMRIAMSTSRWRTTWLAISGLPNVWRSRA